MTDVITATGRYIVYTIIAVVFITYMPGLPPNIEPKVINFPEQRKLEGPLAPNGILDKTENFIGPESSGGDSPVEDGDTVYLSLPGGTIAKYSEKEGFKNIAMTGEPCDMVWEERKCGHPLGMRMSPEKKLIICDPLQGVIKMDPKTGDKEKIVNVGTQVEGTPVNFPDDLDVGKDGTIYWSDLTQVEAEDGFIDVLSGVPTGRLMKTNPKTKETKVLIKDLLSANGVQLSPNEDFVLVGESMQMKVHRYWLKGDKKGTQDVFIDKLPGIPDNIRSNGKGGFYIPILLPRDPSVDLIGQYPSVRKFLIRIYAITRKLILAMEYMLPKNTYLGAANVFMKDLVFAVGDQNARAFLIETDVQGNIIGSLHSEKELATVGENYTYFGNAKYPVRRIKNSELATAKASAAATAK